MKLEINSLGNLEFLLELLLAEVLYLYGVPTRKRFLLRMSVPLTASVLVSLIFSYEWLGSWLTEPLFSIGLILRFLMLLVISVFGICFAFQCSGYQAFLWGVCSYIVQNMAFSAAEILNVGWELCTGRVMSHMAYVGVKCLVFPAVYAVIWRLYVHRIRQATDRLEIWKASALGAGMLFLVIALSSRGHNLEAADRLWFRVMEVLGCVLGYIIVVELLKNRRLEAELGAIRSQMALQASHYERIRADIEATNIRCHDVRHLIAQVRRKLEDNGLECEETLNTLEETVNVYDQVAKTGNPTLDTVLTEKAVLCAREGIRFTYMADSERLRLLSDDDLYCLFGNALDNAIRAAEQVKDPERRVIHLTALSKGAFLTINVCNYFDGILTLKEGLPVTTQDAASGHGYGMKSIRMIAQQHGGNLEVSCDHGIFDLNIVLPLAAAETKTGA